MKVVGIRRVDFESDGKSIHGYKYYCTDVDDNVVGNTTDSFFASDRVVNSLKKDISLDDEVIPCYKRDSRSLSTIIIC